MEPAEVRAHFDQLAELRIRVFRDFPYLYDGDLAYERRYLAPLETSRNSIVVGAWKDDILVGAATGMPMEDHAEVFASAFADRPEPIKSVLYCAESVLLPEYRGQGIGRCFFDLREAHAQRLGRRWSAFCAVIRAPDDPRRPSGYRPLDGFWRKRGYRKLSGSIVRFHWRDIGDAQETLKSMQFWIRRLDETTP
jgi:GNAT superfamily N-acetyltransferase